MRNLEVGPWPAPAWAGQRVVEEIVINEFRWTAFQIYERNAAGRRLEIANRVRAFPDNRGGRRQIRLIQLHAQNLSLRRVFRREKINRIVPAQFDVERVASELRTLHLIFEARDLFPFSLRRPQIMRILTAISIG